MSNGSVPKVILLLLNTGVRWTTLPVTCGPASVNRLRLPRKEKRPNLLLTSLILQLQTTALIGSNVPANRDSRMQKKCSNFTTAIYGIRDFMFAVIKAKIDNGLMVSNGKEVTLMTMEGRNKYLSDPFDLFLFCDTIMGFAMCFRRKLSYGV